MQYVEKPPDEELNRLLENYGRLRTRIVDMDFRHIDEKRDYPPCFGEVVLLIHDSEGRLATVRKRGSPDGAYGLPMGRISEAESVEEAAVREAFEETGRAVKVEEVVALHRVRYKFMRWNLERWTFILLCRPLTDEGAPQDTEEIEEVKFVRLPDEIPLGWVRTPWYLWVLKDAELLHPHAFLLGKAPSGTNPGTRGEM